MWNKEKREGPVQYAPQSAPQAAPPSAPRPAGEPREVAYSPERPQPPKAPGGFALIGRSITIHGDVTGDEDLLIQGRVHGSVDLKQHAVTVGTEGEVRADISARVVTVEGRVVGNLTGQEQVVLRASARVEGDIAAPRVVLEEGTLFRGSVEMGEIQNVPQRALTSAGKAEKAPEPAPKATEPERPVPVPVAASAEEAVKPKAGSRAAAEVRG